MTSKSVFKNIFILSVWTLTSLLILGCDVSARRDLRNAEKLLKKADELHAERWAEKEYHLAQKFFTEAMDLARERKINEARDAAAISREWCEEAINWSKIRAAEMEKEKQRLGTYSD